MNFISWRKRCLLIHLCFLAIGYNSYAQINRTSEQEVTTQKIFIEANREKILGNYENAAKLYQEVLKRDEKNHATSYELARIYDVLDKDSEALKAIQQAIKYDGNNIWYRMFLADVHEKKGNYKESAKVYEALSKQDDDSNFDIYYHKWAYYLIKSKDAAKAIKVYDELEKIIGISEEVCQKKHRLYLGQGNHKKAAAELEKLIKAYPSEINYRHALASFYQQISSPDQAIAEYKNILKQNPDDARAKMALAGFKKGGSKDVTYLQSLKPIFEKGELDIDEKMKELMPYISKVAETGDKDLAAVAMELTDILTTVHPKEAKSYSAYGDLLYHSGQSEEALVKFKKAVALDDSVFPIWEQICFIAVETNNNEVLDQYATDAIDLFPNQAKAYYFKGIALTNQKNYKKAIGEFEQALLMSRKPSFLKSNLLHRLGNVYFQTEAFDKSFKAFDEALAINPKNPNLLNDYSFHLAAKGEQLDKAVAMIQQANELAPNQAFIQDTYGFVLYKKRDFKKAKEWMTKALATDGERSPAILEHYGDLLFEMNEKDKALRYWQKAVEQGSTSKSLQKKINEAGMNEQ